MASDERALRIFDMRHGVDFSFVMPGVMIGGHYTVEDYVDGKWVLTQNLHGKTYTVSHEAHYAAVLLLVALRLGFTGELREAGE